MGIDQVSGGGGGDGDSSGLSNPLEESLDANNYDILNARELDSESLVIGGTLYEEDGNSPFTVSDQSSATYTISGAYDEIILIPERNNTGFNQLRVNGQSTSDYDRLDVSGAKTSGETELNFGGPRTRSMVRAAIVLNKDSGFIGFDLKWGNSFTGNTIYGAYEGGSETSIDSLAVLDSGGSNRSLSARVYGRVMNI